MSATLASQPFDAPVVEEIGAALLRGQALEIRTGDTATEVDEATASLILGLLRARVADHSVLVQPLPDEMTTGQAAELLEVSRPTVVAMVDRGELPARMIGTHRRIKTVDVLHARESAASERRRALDELTDPSVDAGLYD